MRAWRIEELKTKMFQKIPKKYGLLYRHIEKLGKWLAFNLVDNILNLLAYFQAHKKS